MSRNKTQKRNKKKKKKNRKKKIDKGWRRKARCVS